MAFDTHRFCWHGIISTDPEKAGAFYTESVGWQLQSAPMGEEQATMFAAVDGAPRAHVMAPPMPGVPSHWQSYLRVEDVDAATRKAVDNGGRQVVPPTDIPVGRFSTVTSPSGAAFSLFRESDPASTNADTRSPGSVHWTELHSTDPEADLAWLVATFGFDLEEMPVPDGVYTVLKTGPEQAAGGVVKSFMRGAPSMWLSWVVVDDVDATLERVRRCGGQVFGEPMDMQGIGRMCVVADSTGAAFGVITPPQA